MCGLSTSWVRWLLVHAVVLSMTRGSCTKGPFDVRTPDPMESTTGRHGESTGRVKSVCVDEASALWNGRMASLATLLDPLDGKVWDPASTMVCQTRSRARVPSSVPLVSSSFQTGIRMARSMAPCTAVVCTEAAVVGWRRALRPRE